MGKLELEQGSTRKKLSWNVPPRNPFFTGREDELARLHALLQGEVGAQSPAFCALSGPTGVGKSQLACKYAYRYRQAYEDVFWVDGETPDRLASQLAALAPALAPSVSTLPDQEAALRQVRAWFASHGGWLLIVDGTANLPELDALLPYHPRGRILLTTRERVPPDAGNRIEIERMDEAMGALLLLRCAGKLTLAQTLNAAEAAWQEGARAVSREVNGLPLALVHAGAFLAQQNVTPQKYLALYRARAARLPRAQTGPDYHAAAVTTALALEQMKRLPRIGEYAAEIALFGAFAGSDFLPDELCLRGKSVRDRPTARPDGSALNLEEVRAAACDYGLLRPAPDLSGLWMHGLTREALRESVSPEVYGGETERFVLAVEAAFPWPAPADWPLCERLWPHALRCEEYIASGEMSILMAAYLLDKMAAYMQQRIRYEDALRLRKAHLRVTRLMHGAEHVAVTTALNSLGRLCRDIGREEDAARYLTESIAIGLRLENHDTPDRALALRNLAEAFHRQGRLDEAAARYKQALKLARRALGSLHPETAARLRDMALVYTDRKRYKGAESLLLEALFIARQTLGEQHHDYALILVILARSYIEEGRFAEAAPLLRQALSIEEQVYGAQHTAPAYCRMWLGAACYRQRDLAAAAALFHQAWETRERVLGPQHRETRAAREWMDKVQAELNSQ